ncbi:hypothetical protein CDL15_Pgr016914 [Punica granatum]|uniref:Uncharacterized protein n=1 Tax=Punica granatum TaxID=22663 RepID=A0A218WY91_PUNGR|nr:hypothetical protein CDL15_Pgr016914 [Punica granatum]
MIDAQSVLFLFTAFTTVKLEMQKLSDGSEHIAKAKGQTCFQLLEVQRKVSALESDSCMLIQSLELMQQERAGLSAKLLEQSAFYTKVAEELNAKFQDQLEHFHSHRCTIGQRKHSMGQGNEKVKRHKLNLRTAITRFNEIRGLNAQIVAENAEMKEYIMQMKCRASDFKVGGGRPPVYLYIHLTAHSATEA